VSDAQKEGVDDDQTLEKRWTRTQIKLAIESAEIKSENQRFANEVLEEPDYFGKKVEDEVKKFSGWIVRREFVLKSEEDGSEQRITEGELRRTFLEPV